MSHYVPRDVLLNLYYSLVYPYLIYCTVAWGGSAAVNINKLLIQQKKVVRLITNSGYRDHSDPLFHRTGILKIIDIHTYLSGILAYKRKDTFSVADHSHYTRNSAVYSIPSFQRLNISQKSLSYILPVKWNDIPLNIRNSPSLSTFKKNFKLCLLSPY